MTERVLGSGFGAVRLPLLAPSLLIAALFRALDAFRIFDLVYVLTGGGPADSTEVLSTLTYKNLFSALQFGYGSALSTTMFVTEILVAIGFGFFLFKTIPGGTTVSAFLQTSFQGARLRYLIGRVFLYVSAALIVAWSAAPFLWQFSTSFQLDRDLVGSAPKLWPDPISFDHFINIFVAKSFHRYLFNSLVVAGLTTLLCLLIGSIAAYALARLNVRGRFGILGFVLAVSMFPQIAVVAPLYMLASQLGWLDTYRILITVYLALGLPFVTWVLFGHFRTIPKLDR